MTRIEALADAFGKINGWHDPLSDAYRLRNPGMLKAFSPKHIKDEKGNRVFNSFPSGYDNLILDLKIKCSGGSHSRLKPDDTLINLVLCYQMPETAATYIKKFLRHALRDENIMERQQLGWFLEDQPQIQKSSPAASAVAVGE